MPFQKGHKLNESRKKQPNVVEEQAATVEKVEFESVMDEMQASALERDEIVPKAPEKPTQQAKEIVIPQLDLNDVDFSNIHGWNMAELELYDPGLNRVPNPPKCVMEWCNQHDLKWRWMSYPSVKHSGMRGHVAFSVPVDIRKKIKNGDCPPTIDIDVTNKLVWREDAFLGVIPRRLADLQLKAIRQRTLDQTKLAKAAPGGLREMASRAGGKLVEFNVEETTRQGL
jgi:hypothetical protein